MKNCELLRGRGGPSGKPITSQKLLGHGEPTSQNTIALGKPNYCHFLDMGKIHIENFCLAQKNRVFGYSTIARIWRRKKFACAGKPALVCLYLHVREYIVMYTSEIKMYISVITLRSVWVY